MTTAKTLLSIEERAICEQISSEAAPDGQRAAALMALDEGATQAQASEQSGLTRGQVKYWLSKFRSQRLGIFPEELLGQEATDESPDPPTEPVLATEAAPEPEPAEAEQKPPVEIVEEVSRPVEKTTEAKKEPAGKGKKKKKKKKSKKSKKDKKGAKDQEDQVKKKKKKKSKKKKSKKSEGSKKSKGKKESSKEASSKKKKSKGSKKKKKSKK